MINRIAAVTFGALLAVVAPSGASATRLVTPAAGPSGEPAAARPSIGLSPDTGPPGTSVTVRGAGFAAYETVDVYFDTTDLALASTTGAGAFTTRLTVPAPARPGVHWVTGNGRRSRRSAQARFTVQANWPEFLADPAHTGDNATENVLDPSDVAGLGLDWSHVTGGILGSSPAVVNGTVFIGSLNHKVYALNAATGAVKWSYTTGDYVSSSPAVVNGTVYIGSDDHKVYALNAATGAVKWAYTTGNWVTPSPAVVNGTVYVGSGDGKVYALNAVTGAVRWTRVVGGFINSSPAVANGVVYIGSGYRTVYALSAATGAVKWSRVVGGSIYPAPTVADGLVYIGSDNDKLYALNAVTGVKDWTHTTSDPVRTSAAVADGLVYVTSLNGEVYALSAYTGARRWVYHPGGYPGGISYGSPAVANGVVYVGEWAVAGGKVYALNAATGAVDWVYTTGVGISCSPAVVNGTVYIGASDGSTYAFGLPGGTTDGVRRPVPATLRPDRQRGT